MDRKLREIVLNNCMLDEEKHQNRTYISTHANDPIFSSCCAAAAVPSAILPWFTPQQPKGGSRLDKKHSSLGTCSYEWTWT